MSGRRAPSTGSRSRSVPESSWGWWASRDAGRPSPGLSVLGLLPQTAVITGGSISFDGEDLLRADAARMRAVRGRRISMIFQDPTSSLNPVFTVGSQLERVVEEHLGLSGAEAREKARASLASVGLSDIDRIRGAYPASAVRRSEAAMHDRDGAVM